MNDLKKVAFICHPYHRGGVTRWMADAALYFAGLGYEVSFFTVRPRKPFKSGKNAETMISLLGAGHKNLKVFSAAVDGTFEFGTPDYGSYVYRKLLTTHLAPGTPLILSDDLKVWIAATDLAASYPIIGVLHSDDDLYYRLAARYYQYTDALVCVSKRIVTNIKKTLPEITPEKLSVIPCGIELQNLNRKEKAATDPLKLVYVGRVIETQKRVTDLFHIAQELHSQNIAFQLTIVGDGGDDKKNLETRFEASSFAGNVRFTGWQSKQEVAHILSASDILILTSDFEGTPISMMEALAAGCGFVGTRVSGIEDYEANPNAPDCYRVFETGDISDAVKKIIQVAATPPETRIRAARTLAETEFSMQICIDRYRVVINSLPDKTYKAGSASLAAGKHIQSLLISWSRMMKYRLTNGK